MEGPRLTNGWFTREWGDSQEARLSGKLKQVCHLMRTQLKWLFLPLERPASSPGCRKLLCASHKYTSSWDYNSRHSDSKGSRNLCAPWHEGQLRNCCPLCSPFARLAVGMVGGWASVSWGAGRAASISHSHPSVQLVAWANVSHLCCISANHPWGVRPLPISRGAFNEDWPNSSKNRSQLACD